MVDTNTMALGGLIIIFFLWRYFRTRQLYLTSLRVLESGSEPITFDPHDLRSFIDQTMMGRRSVGYNSFFIRMIVYVIVVLCLYPFKNYQPTIFWLIVSLTSFYIPWCVVHGVLLKRKTMKFKGRS
jgi:hypothetical protein